jgi:choline dehydrogenase
VSLERSSSTATASRYDYIVVGGGSSGCVTASRLVREFGARVLLLEAGWPDNHPLIRMPAGFVRIIFNPGRFVTAYQSEPQPALGGRSVSILQANVLGGGSSVNAMTYTRGTRADYDRWDQAIGGRGWAWADLLPHFVRLEANQRLGAPQHGTDGPLKVSDAHHPITDTSRACLLTLQEMGIPFTPDVNAGDERGATYIQSTTYRGERWSAARAFIAPIANDPRLTIKYRSPALRILFEGTRAVGVEHGVDGTTRTAQVFAGNEVILTAGAFISPKLLMLSGVGPAAHLTDLGIGVRVDLLGVGQNMQDHNDATLTVSTDRNYGYSGEDRGWRMLVNGLQYLLFKSGPVTSTGSEVTAFFNPENPAGEPTIQLYCMGTLYPTPGSRKAPPPGATLFANLIAPKSRGAMRLRSPNPGDPPVIDPGWLSRDEDVRALVAGVRFLRKLTQTQPFRRMVTGELTPGSDAVSDEHLANYVRKVTSTNWHPVGSCRMGPDTDPSAVLDANLRVRGTENLRVFDASMMPSIIHANTNAPVMAIADRAVDLMMGVQTLRQPSDHRQSLSMPAQTG